jgi:(p)ppGpp synthase/HD superfamily hydrolase
MSDLEILKNLVLAPYILKATALIGVKRRVGGNQFRHCFSVLGILLDYKLFYDSILLKASVLHDLFEDWPYAQLDDILHIDNESQKVLELVMEVTKDEHEPKSVYLERLLKHGSKNAMLLKCADRISNLTDLHIDTHDNDKIIRYLDETEKYVIPMAKIVNQDMVKELTDLVNKRRRVLRILPEEKRE